MSTPVAKQYIKNFEKLGFGMFVHFGLYLIIGEGEYLFKDFPCDIENVHWMDNGELLEASYENGNLTVNFTGYSYGTDYCVRVAKGNVRS